MADSCFLIRSHHPVELGGVIHGVRVVRALRPHPHADIAPRPWMTSWLSAPAGPMYRIVRFGEQASGGTECGRLSAAGQPGQRQSGLRLVAARQRVVIGVVGLVVGAVHAHQLAAVHGALAGEHHQAGLIGTPGGQCERPRLGPAEVRDLLARLDHRAIDVAD
ncbi:MULTISPECIES: hypothetical protein [unclassified Nocardia]|uniref:hypothetical protein n=1 Tax=unclassified Nocardia TaxID=2637762 RepID=UPI0024A99F27|nr:MULTISPECIES: hypothetical protein [unclassified Nocardia]